MEPRLEQYLAEQRLTDRVVTVLPLTGDASDRRYFRLLLKDSKSIVSLVRAGSTAVCRQTGRRSKTNSDSSATSTASATTAVTAAMTITGAIATATTVVTMTIVVAASASTIGCDEFHFLSNPLEVARLPIYPPVLPCQKRPRFPRGLCHSPFVVCHLSSSISKPMRLFPE